MTQTPAPRTFSPSQRSLQISKPLCTQGSREAQFRPVRHRETCWLTSEKRTFASVQHKDRYQRECQQGATLLRAENTDLMLGAAMATLSS